MSRKFYSRKATYDAESRSIEEVFSIEFPCAYPIKVMGVDEDNYRDEVLKIIRRHAPDMKDEDVSCRYSRNKTYLAVNVIIQAAGPDQLRALFDDLKASGRVKMVL